MTIEEGQQVIILQNNNGDSSRGWADVGIAISGKDLTQCKGLVTKVFDGQRTDARLSGNGLEDFDNLVDCEVATTSSGDDYPQLGKSNDVGRFYFKFSALEKV